MATERTPRGAVESLLKPVNGLVVLVMQGGGALGAYQGGVYEALHEAGIELDWIIGTSIGAVNGAIICGNTADRRLGRLTEFWRRVKQTSFWGDLPFLREFGEQFNTWNAFTQGIPGFFATNPHAFQDPQNAGYYSTLPLRETLTELVDLEQLRRAKPRLKVGAAQVRTSVMRYFDSRDMPLTIDHIMASGAIPPAFPPIRIDGELYWDGGIMSNSPIEAIFDEKPRRSALVFAVNMWHPTGPEPKSVFDVLERVKDIQFSSRLNDHVARQLETHRLRRIIAELSRHLPQEYRANPGTRDMTAFGCTTLMHIVQLLAPRLGHENHIKEMDFTPQGIEARWKAAYNDTKRVLDRAPWLGEFPAMEGVILHNASEVQAVMPAKIAAAAA
jgi:NTE family protein